MFSRCRYKDQSNNAAFSPTDPEFLLTDCQCLFQSYGPRSVPQRSGGTFERPSCARKVSPRPRNLEASESRPRSVTERSAGAGPRSVTEHSACIFERPTPAPERSLPAPGRFPPGRSKVPVGTLRGPAVNLPPQITLKYG